MAEHQVMSCLHSHNSYTNDFVSHQADVRPGSAPAVAPLPVLRRPVVARPRGIRNRRKRHSTPTPVSVVRHRDTRALAPTSRPAMQNLLAPSSTLSACLHSENLPCHTPLVPRFGFQRRLTRGVRPCGRERNPKTKTRRPGHGLMTTAGKTRDTQDRERPRQRTLKTENPPRESRSTTKDGPADAPRSPPMRGPTRFPASRSWGRGRGPGAVPRPGPNKRLVRHEVVCVAVMTV